MGWVQIKQTENRIPIKNTPLEFSGNTFIRNRGMVDKWLVIVLALFILFLVWIVLLFADKDVQLRDGKWQILVSQKKNQTNSEDVNKILNITRNSSYQMSPVIHKNKIAWKDLRKNKISNCRKGFLAHQPCVSQIYLYDISSGKVGTVSREDSWESGIQLTDSFILWTERKNQMSFGNDVNILKNLKTLEEKIVNENLELIDNDQAIVKESHKVYLLDLNTDTRMLILETEDTPSSYDGFGNVKVSGNYLVWEKSYWKEGGEFGIDVYGKKLKGNGEEYKITSFKSGSKYKHSVIKLYRNIVVWEEYEKENPEAKSLDGQYYAIYAFNLNTGEKKKVVSKIGGQSAPNIYGEYIVYSDSRNQSYKVLNFYTNKIQTINIKKMGPGEIKIDNNYVIWVDGGNNLFPIGDVYLMSLD